jgi:hypothetical protein
MKLKNRKLPRKLIKNHHQTSYLLVIGLFKDRQINFNATIVKWTEFKLKKI